MVAPTDLNEFIPVVHLFLEELTLSMQVCVVSLLVLQILRHVTTGAIVSLDRGRTESEIMSTLRNGHTHLTLNGTEYDININILQDNYDDLYMTLKSR